MFGVAGCQKQFHIYVNVIGYQGGLVADVDRDEDVVHASMNVGNGVAGDLGSNQRL